MKYIFIYILLLNCLQSTGQNFTKLQAGLGQPGTIRCSAVDTILNRVYVAGIFTSLDNIDPPSSNGVFNIYYFDSSWHYLTSANSQIFNLTIINGILYVGGAFDSIGNISANAIAAYNGINWAPLGSGMHVIDSVWNTSLTGGVYDIAFYNGNIIACGNFNLCDASAAKGIAEWDGSSWIPLAIQSSMIPFGFYNSINNIESFQGKLYFNLVGNLIEYQSPVNQNILAQSVNYGMSVSSQKLYFCKSSGVEDSIMGYNGINLSLEQSLSDFSGFLQCIDDTLYFGQEADSSINFEGWGSINIFSLANSSISAIVNFAHDCSSIHETILTGGKFNGKLFFGGDFFKVENIPCNSLTIQSATSFETFACISMNQTLYAYYGAICFDSIKNILYASGTMKCADDSLSHCLVGWNGIKWCPVKPGIQHYVKHLCMFQGNLYVHELWAENANSTNWNSRMHFRVKKYDGNNWQTIIPKTKGRLFGLKALNNELYAFGSFDTVDNIFSRNIIKFDGNSLLPLGGSSLISGAIYDIENLGSRIFAIGQSLTLQQNPTIDYGIIALDTNTWNPRFPYGTGNKSQLMKFHSKLFFINDNQINYIDSLNDSTFVTVQSLQADNFFKLDTSLFVTLNSLSNKFIYRFDGNAFIQVSNHSSIRNPNFISTNKYYVLKAHFSDFEIPGILDMNIIDSPFISIIKQKPCYSVSQTMPIGFELTSLSPFTMIDTWSLPGALNPNFNYTSSYGEYNTSGNYFAEVSINDIINNTNMMVISDSFSVTECFPSSLSPVTTSGQSILIYPNPCSTFFEIKLFGIPSITSFEVYNTLGQLVKLIKNDLKIPQLRIDVSQLKNGIYFLKAGILTKKIVIDN